MIGLLIVLTPILIADVLNPVLFAGVVYGLGSRHPMINAWGVLLSYFLTYFLAGLILAVALETLTDYLQIPVAFEYALELFVAALLFFFAWKMYKEGDQHPEQRLKQDPGMTLGSAIALGVQINLVGLPFAIPYLAAIDQMLKARLSVTATVFVLFLYNVFYLLPFAFLILLRFVYKEESEEIFEKINLWIHETCIKYMPIIFVILALLLVEDAVSFFLGYREYSFLSLYFNQS